MSSDENAWQSQFFPEFDPPLGDRIYMCPSWAGLQLAAGSLVADPLQ
jgi:hypothetical protein